MAAAIATTTATFQVIPGAEDKIAFLEAVVNVLDQRTVATITARQRHGFLEGQRLQALADCFAGKFCKAVRAVAGLPVFDGDDCRVAHTPAVCCSLFSFAGKFGITGPAMFCVHMTCCIYLAVLPQLSAIINE